MITFKQKGDFSKLDRYFERIKEFVHLGKLDEYGRRGVEALRAATPVDTGATAAAWKYEIHHDRGLVTIAFTNDRMNDGVHIAILLEYGHATRDGGWVEGLNYIGPNIKPVFNEIANDAWRRITDL